MFVTWKKYVFSITNNVLKTSAYKLFLLLRKSVQDMGWYKYTEVIVDSFRILKAQEIGRRNLLPRIQQIFTVELSLPPESLRSCFLHIFIICFISQVNIVLTYQIANIKTFISRVKKGLGKMYLMYIILKWRKDLMWKKKTQTFIFTLEEIKCKQNNLCIE